ncbi:protein E2 [BeAn 58058 virus]|uniref:protein E2 n=1 Tax=BeAn 58058 virus TaxID=67082 RepID=UPI00090BD36C|nr:protein E2 [BeAn 58058 virus]APG58242.1 protein E2 [BeAn 58058 virus]
MLTDEQLSNEELKNYIIKKINLGEIENYKSYASKYLYNKQENLGIYKNIFFDEVFDITQYDITKEQLVIICKYLDRYELYINYLINYLIKENHFDILASIIDKIPVEILTEELCIRLICESNTKIMIKDIPIHSSLIMVMCIQMGYDDLVDLLDSIELNALIEKNADIITDYVLTTNWYNIEHELLYLFVKKYGFCTEKINKLLFEYPLTLESIRYLLNIIDNYSQSDMIYSVNKTLFYLTCTVSNLKIEKIQRISKITFSDKEYNNYINISDKTKVRSIILYNNIPGVDKTFFNNIVYKNTNFGICIYKDAINNKVLTSEKSICTEIYNIATLIRYGLIYFPYLYFPSWVPIIDIINGYKYTTPCKIEYGVIYKTTPIDFVEYKSIGKYISNIYYLKKDTFKFSRHNKFYYTNIIIIFSYWF